MEACYPLHIQTWYCLNLTSILGLCRHIAYDVMLCIQHPKLQAFTHYCHADEWHLFLWVWQICMIKCLQLLMHFKSKPSSNGHQITMLRALQRTNKARCARQTPTRYFTAYAMKMVSASNARPLRRLAFTAIMIRRQPQSWLYLVFDCRVEPMKQQWCFVNG